MHMIFIIAISNAFLVIQINKTWHRTKINHNFSSWDEILWQVPQGSVLSPLFYIYLNDLFYLIASSEMCRNFGDDALFFTCVKDLNSLIKRLEHDSLPTTEWSQNNNIKLNRDKCHLLVSGYKHELGSISRWNNLGK